MKIFTGGIIGGNVGLLTSLSIQFLTGCFASWWFGFFIILMGILNILACVNEWRKPKDEIGGINR